MFTAVTMEAGGDDDVADGQHVQPSSANTCPTGTREEKSNGSLTF